LIFKTRPFKQKPKEIVIVVATAAVPKPVD